MSGIILGPGLIGEAASLKAQQTAVDDAGGGSIQVGPGLKDSGKFKKRALAQAAAPLPVPLVPVMPTLVDRATVSVPVTGPGLSEDDIEVMLAGDPDAWDIIIEAEGKRAEGFRPRVAQMLFLAAPEAKAKPVPAEVVAHLQRIAQVGVEADAVKMSAAADAAGEIGTGDPDAVVTAAPKSTRRARG